MEPKHDHRVNCLQSVVVMAESKTMSGPVALIVGDEFLVRAILCDILEDGGFDIIEAANADEAVRILESRTDIRIVITDIDMPGSMDGLRLAHAVRGRWPPIELIVVSGTVAPNADKLPDRAVFFAKPYNSAQLLAAAQQFVNGDPAWLSLKKTMIPPTSSRSLLPSDNSCQHRLRKEREATMSNPPPRLEWFSRHLIEILPAAVYVCDMDAVIVAFNKRATELWGRTPKLGQTDEKFCGAHRLYRPDGTYLPHPETPMEWVLRTGETARDQEVIIERPDGSRVPVLVNIAPVFDDDGVQKGAVNCFQDLTARKESEQEREELREQLHQAQKMEAVGQLTGGLAHDFNNILAGISGSLEILQRRIGQGRVGDLERYVTAAQDAAKRAAALTNHLLAFSRRQTLEAKLTEANTLVAGLGELINGTVGSAIAVEIVMADGLWSTLVDPNQLENALLNLCINARDAMPRGGKLELTTANVNLNGQFAVEHDLPPGQYISLSVSDNGVGMAPDVLARAFEPFYTTKPAGAGTGLGLSMIYGFARQFGGHAAIHSEPGKGTTVCLYLPRHFDGEEQLETTAARAVSI
jgi:PAS domain S-box-containing protein